jgi:hypothetical protein
MKKICGILLLLSFAVVNISAQQSEKPNLDVKEIIFVFKTHFDNGYTDMAESVISKYSTTMMEKALTTLEKSRRTAYLKARSEYMPEIKAVP